MEEKKLQSSYIDLLPINWLNGKAALSVPLHSVHEAQTLWDSFGGVVIPSVEAASFPDPETLRVQVTEALDVVPVVSIALGNDGDASQWWKALVASRNLPVHVNQPAVTAPFALEYLSKQDEPILVNGIVEPTDRKDIVRVAVSSTRITIETEIGRVLDLFRENGIRSLKLHPIRGIPYDILSDIGKLCSQAGIEIIEPAGGLNQANFAGVMQSLLSSGISRVFPHVFSAVENKERTSLDLASVAWFLSQLNTIVSGT